MTVQTKFLFTSTSSSPTNKKELNQGFVTATILALCLMLALAPDARAEESNWYVGANMPIMFIDDTKTDLSIAGPSQVPGLPISASSVTKYGTGFRLSGIVGYQINPNIRVEGEVFFGKAKVNKLTFALGPNKIPVPVSGAAKQQGAMVNVWYDAINSDSKWTPYVGLGLGYIKVNLGGVKYDNNNLIPGPPGLDNPLKGNLPERLSPTDTALAFQFGAGVSYKKSDAVTIDLGYRLQTTKALEFKGKKTAFTVTSESKLRVHLFHVGIRYRY